jgi:hypothetical protein
MTLATRLDRLEARMGGAGDCPVCRGEPPWAVQYDGAPPTGTPCPGCGGLRVVAVAYVDETIAARRGDG